MKGILPYLLIPLSFFFSSPIVATELRVSCPHAQISFKVELSQTPQELEKGLMNREKLGENEGMLFLFPEPHPVTMWMKNTPLSLDIIFINRKGKIVAIAENTTPHSLNLIGPIENTAQVLEIAGGKVKKKGISKACSVSYSTNAKADLPKISDNKYLGASMTPSTPPLALKGDDKIITATTVSEVKGALLNLSEGAVIFIDVDDTLITPQSKVFRSSSPFRTIIDQIKKQRDRIPHVERILSHWRLQRKIRLVSDEWPDFINILKKNYPVYALTKLETGRVGAIPSMEQWRYNELKGLGITFTPSCPGISEGTLVKNSSHPYPATFTKGIFMTGSFNKSDVIAAFLKAGRPPQIVLIDDRPEYIKDALEECNRQSLPFLGILFKGEELIAGEADPRTAEFQKQHLLEHGEWVEDEEAEKKVDPHS
ncbi:MAG: DUF192 domain-containing protein [Alphaproteobacteria bacterium]|nr:DUF192 domain-containing protein [Alphaproteobacteria bacterium]